MQELQNERNYTNQNDSMVNFEQQNNNQNIKNHEALQNTNNQNVEIELVTGELIKSKLTFVSKSASASTRTFRVEAKVSNASGKIRDGITGTMTILTNKVLANKISPSILLLSDEGDLGVRAVNENDEVKFLPINIIEDTNDGIWVTGIPNLSKLIVLGQGFVRNGEKVQTTFLSDV